MHGTVDTDAIIEQKTSKGNVFLVKIVSHEMSSTEPKDMVDWANFGLIGYKDKKPIAECTFEEFQEVYSGLFNN